MLLVFLLLLSDACGLVVSPVGRRSSSTSLCATKKKKGKKKAPKTSGMEWARSFTLMPYDSTPLRELAANLVGSYESKCGNALHDSLKGSGNLPKSLWAAPVGVLVVSENETISYANAAACEALNATHETLIGDKSPFPSSMQKGYESQYSKKVDQVTFKKIKRWKVEKAAIVDGTLAQLALGIGYMFDNWEMTDGTICEPGGVRKPPIPDNLEEAVEKQAAFVRRLKEVHEKTNKDPEVVDAVAELLRLKALLDD